MLIKNKSGIEIPSSEITPKHIYLNRRTFMKGAAVVTAAGLVAACRPAPPEGHPAAVATQAAQEAAVNIDPTTGAVATATPRVDELGDPWTPYRDVTNYNNYYEFTTDKNDVAKLAQDFQTSPWQVTVGGMVKNPGVYDIDDLRTKFDQEERVYRLRCVEAWSMVIPWMGFPLRKLLEEIEPTSEAKYVRFETLNDPEQMPGLRSPWYSWPYVEGLRIDEAMNDLAILATGLYGRGIVAAEWGSCSSGCAVEIRIQEY